MLIYLLLVLGVVLLVLARREHRVKIRKEKGKRAIDECIKRIEKGNYR